MCGTCESGRARRWTSTHLILLAFVAALLVLSAAGVIARVRTSGSQTLGVCAAASTAAVRFQSVVTRDLRNHTSLHFDTNGYVSELRSLGAASCPATRRFVRGAEETLSALCDDCIVVLRRARPVGS